LDENTILGQLEELARSLSIEIRYEPLRKEGSFTTGGLCRLKDQFLVIINSKAVQADKIEALASAVSRFDLSQIYLRPGLREFLDTYKRRHVPGPEED